MCLAAWSARSIQVRTPRPEEASGRDVQENSASPPGEQRHSRSSRVARAPSQESDQLRRADTRRPR
jgi:hypothetical protein